MNKFHWKISISLLLKGNILFFLSFCLLNCHPALKKDIHDPKEAMRAVRFFYPDVHDDMDIDSISMAIKRNLTYLDKLDPDSEFVYGSRKVTCRLIKESQEAFLDLIMKKPGNEDFEKEIKRNFRFFRAAGRVGNKKVLFTGYYEPIYEASLVKDQIYKHPIYNRPDDLIRIDLSIFNKKFTGESIVARIGKNKVLPYYSRKQIEIEKVLKGKNLEIAWLKDPLDVAFLHIQGSGRLKLPDNEMISVGYKASNGRKYRSIGKYLMDMGVISREEMSMQSIRKYLAAHPDIMDQVLNYNPSYVFFSKKKNGPFGNIGVTLTPGRSIALSSRLFPKGALCFIRTEKPIINSRDEIERWVPFSRFVVNQDTGGAIKGAGRADIFWGSGTYAEVTAGHMKHEGDLYILLKKS